jgi:hypothetical protein
MSLRKRDRGLVRERRAALRYHRRAEDPWSMLWAKGNVAAGGPMIVGRHAVRWHMLTCDSSFSGVADQHLTEAMIEMISRPGMSRRWRRHFMARLEYYKALAEVGALSDIYGNPGWRYDLCSALTCAGIEFKTICTYVKMLAAADASDD